MSAELHSLGPLIWAYIWGVDLWHQTWVEQENNINLGKTSEPQRLEKCKVPLT